MMLLPASLALSLLSFVIQEYSPGLAIAHYASIMLPVLYFFVASVAVPYPMMLTLAFVTGLLWDARHLPGPLQQTGPSAENLSSGVLALPELAGTGHLPLGASVIIFAVLGAMMQGVRPQYRRGRIELPVLMVGVATALWLAIEYLLHCLIRSSLPLPHGVIVKWITDTLLAMLCAPALLLIMHHVAGLPRHELAHEAFKSKSP